MREYRWVVFTVLQRASYIWNRGCGVVVGRRKWISVWINAMCERLTTCWKSCWFSGKGHLCRFPWPSWGCDCDGTTVSQQRITPLVCAHVKHTGLSQCFSVDYFISIFTQLCNRTKTASKQNWSKTPYMGKKRKKKKLPLRVSGRWQPLAVTSWFTPFCPGHSILPRQHPQFRSTSRTKDSPEAWLVSLNRIQTNNLPRSHGFTAHW